MLETKLTAVSEGLNTKLATLEASLLAAQDRSIKQLHERDAVSLEHSTALKAGQASLNALSDKVATLKDTQLVTTEKLNSLLAIESKYEAYRIAQTEINNANNAIIQQLNAKLEIQAGQLANAQALITRQANEIAALQEDTKRLGRESATVESVDQLRKLLYDMQASMIGHSGKVLDLLMTNKGAPPPPAAV